MRKCAATLICGIVCFALPVRAQTSAASLNEELKEFNEEGPRFEQYAVDFSRDFDKASHEPNHLAEGVTLLNLRNLAIASAAEARASYDVLRIYEAVHSESDRAAIRPLVRDALRHCAGIGQGYAQAVKINIGDSEDLNVNVEAIHLEESLDRFSAILTSIAGTLKTTGAHPAP